MKTKLIDEEMKNKHRERLDDNKAFSAKHYRKKFHRKRENKSKAKNCWNCDSKDHFADACTKPPKFESSKSNSTKPRGSGTAKHACSFVVLDSDSKSSKEWYIDSGASHHMTNDDRLLVDKKPSREVRTITSASNSEMEVSSVGTERVILNGTEVAVKNVLHIPEISANLLSVNRIARSGNSVHFEGDNCIITDLSTGEVLVNCVAENGVYKIQPVRVLLAKDVDENDTVTWHRKLGHLNYGTMCDMKAVGNIQFGEDDEVKVMNCEVCAEGKQTRQSFPSSSTKTTEVLQLVHSDVM